MLARKGPKLNSHEVAASHPSPIVDDRRSMTFHCEECMIYLFYCLNQMKYFIFMRFVNMGALLFLSLIHI